MDYGPGMRQPTLELIHDFNITKQYVFTRNNGLVICGMDY